MIYRPRIIPCLTIINKGLVKTVKFKDPRYIGDPINAVKIFNNKGVDELCILDIRATINNSPLDFELLEDIASEAFMPLSYGGGIKTLDEIKKLFHIGYEKVIINSSFVTNKELIKDAIELAGSQSIVIAIDVKSEGPRKKTCYINSGTKKIRGNPLELAKSAELLGAGEILLNSISQDGTMSGYDLELIRSVSNGVGIPVIASGGAGNIIDIKNVIEVGKADAVAASSMFIYYGKHKAVLITVPNEEEFINLGIYQKFNNFTQEIS